MATVSSGVESLDRFLGGFQPGDNVVWVAESGTFVNVFARAFIRATEEDPKNTVVYVNSNHAPQSIYRRFAEQDAAFTFIHVDAFTNGKGKGDRVFQEYYENPPGSKGFESICIDKPADPESFSRILSDIEQEQGEGVRYVFHSLTGLSELWGGERAVQEFFTLHCPKLYELQTVAYWTLEKEAHPRSFLANLSHITQVVIQVRNLEEGFCEMKFQKAEDRPSRILNEALRYRVAEDRVEFSDRMPERTLRLGKRIKDMRTSQNLTQAELARLLNITPSALCQIENDQVQPSLSVVLQLSRNLGCSLDSFFPDSASGRAGARGWIVHKKKDHVPPKVSGSKISMEKVPLLPEGGYEKRITPFLLRIEPETEGPRAFFDHKGPEFGWVMSGLLKIVVDQEEVVLRSGDSIYLEGETVNRWRNEGSTRCELLWVLG